jgi:hypothetical protein
MNGIKASEIFGTKMIYRSNSSPYEQGYLAAEFNYKFLKDNKDWIKNPYYGDSSDAKEASEWSNGFLHAYQILSLEDKINF